MRDTFGRERARETLGGKNKMTNFKRFCQIGTCGHATSKAYARAHNDMCKACNEGTAYRGPKCPDCDGPIDAWKLAKGYHCDGCTRRVEMTGGGYGY